MRAVVGLLLLLGVMVVPRALAADCSTSVTSLNDATTAKIWQEINRHRTTPLQWSDSLALSASWEARDRATHGVLAYPYTDLDSLNRDTRARATACGYRADAQVIESSIRIFNYMDPGIIWQIWYNTDAYHMIQIVNNTQASYTVAALGTYHGADGFDYWVLDAGTLADSQSKPTPQPTSTPTAVPPTATSAPTPTPTATPSNEVDRICTVDRDIQVDQPFVLSCDY